MPPRRDAAVSEIQTAVCGPWSVSPLITFEKVLNQIFIGGALSGLLFTGSFRLLHQFIEQPTG